MKVVILGCGPAGLMAAHGAIAGGADIVQILSKRRKSELFGAQYLHAPIPNAPLQDHVRITYTLDGNAADYRHKVYGPQWDGSVSPEDLIEPHSAWDIRATYDWLWETYQRYIADIDLAASDIGVLAESSDVVISTVPRPALCVRGHTFGSADVWAAGDAPERGIRIPYACDENTVRCNAEPVPLWYRLSNVFGYHTVEWPALGDTRMPIAASLVRKPTFHNCDCHPTVVHAGRYGRWEKGILSHTAYYDALNAVQYAVECEDAK